MTRRQLRTPLSATLHSHREAAPTPATADRPVTQLANSGELLRYRQGQLAVPPHALDLPFPCPLELHAAYTRDELLLALGFWTLESQPDMREGVRYLPALPADLFLITLHKVALPG